MQKTKVTLLLVILILTTITLFIIDNDMMDDKSLIKAKVLATDNTDVMQSSIAKIGHQILFVEILEGKYKGKHIKANNGLQGKPSLDNFYQKGDSILIALSNSNNELSSAQAVDMFRQRWELILFAIFIILLIIYAGQIGLKAIFSFIASLYIIVKFLIPGLLAGHNPILISTVILILLSAVILFSIAGFTKKGVAAFLGTIVGLLAAIGVAIYFGGKFGLEGMTAPYAETLLFSGNMGLNMRQIFYSAIVIGASGAAMDIAMDISASMSEIKEKKPDIEYKELVKSGFNVGKAVIGTMTTTLLLAYSGSYLALLMLFASQNTNYVRMINYKMVASEILRTVTGSIGLVLVAPITAIVAGWILSKDFNFKILD